ncbi:MAG: serine/threonine protein kinase [Candidatus Angelobacter sp.]|nr:serine/threonine protein kinase [Candidatus Angelobacter sp.]
MSLTPGTKLGPYQVVAAVGAGGMGEVYRAKDTRLGRDVAVKVVTAAFASDPERLRRFEQEARAVATLNHPNILSIYDLGTQDGISYIVTELLDGQPLRQRLQQGAIPQRKAIEYALGIANGLATAHEHGIVHRDLKPENLFINTNSDNQIKILDFGLAKVRAASASASDSAATFTPSMAEVGTSAGTVMGSVGYMSPEQVRGEKVDHRSDIFSFGAVLYEMLTGNRAFQRDTGAETMTAILKDDPPEMVAGSSSAMISPGLQRIVNHCLEKNPGERFQSARDLGFALQALSGSDVSGSKVPPVTSSSSRFRRALPWMAGLALLFAVGGWLRPRPSAEEMHFTVSLPVAARDIALSPNGRTLAFVAQDEKTGRSMLFVHAIGSQKIDQLAGTEGASYPFWSPDSKQIAFFTPGKLLRIAPDGGTARTVAPAQLGRGGTWGSAGYILFAPAPAGGLYKVRPEGGTPEQVTKVDSSREYTHRWPYFLPDGKHFIFFVPDLTVVGEGVGELYFGSVDSAEFRRVETADSNASYLPAGYILYARGNKLMVQPFDAKAGTTTGQPAMLTQNLQVVATVFRAELTAAANGTAMFSTGDSWQRSQLTWFDRNGKVTGVVGEPLYQNNPSISPGGDRIAVDAIDSSTFNTDVYVYDVQSGNPTRITFLPVEDTLPIWSHDGKYLYYSWISITNHLSRIPPNSGGTQEEVTAETNLGRIDPNSFSSDGTSLVYSFRKNANRASIWSLHLADRKAAPILEGNHDFFNGMISPDGHWLAYVSNESGRDEIYVTSYPGIQGKWQVSRDGGEEPRWRGDGKEIFFLNANTVMAVQMMLGEGVNVGVPQSLFSTQFREHISVSDQNSYDVSKDGQRFLVNRYVKPKQIPPMEIVLNFDPKQLK